MVWKIGTVVDLLHVNGTDLNSDLPSSFAGKSYLLDHGAKEMKMLNSRIAALQSKIMELENTNSHLTSFLQISSLLATSFPAQSTSDSSSNSEGISCNFNEETLNSSLEPINRKRAVANCCKEVTIDLQGVCEKHHETLACGWSQFYLWQPRGARKGIRNDIRNCKFSHWRQRTEERVDRVVVTRYLSKTFGWYASSILGPALL